jgi:N-acetylneuraminic acid mutarotase
MNWGAWIRRVASAVGLGCVVAASTTSVAFAHPVAGTWKTLAPVPSPTEGMSTAGVGNLIIAAYGFGFFGDTNKTRIYNIAHNTWSFGAPAPLPVSSEGIAVSHGGAVFDLGGRNGAGNDNNRYQPSTNTWKSLAPMPTARDGLGAAVVGDSIYAIGGRSQTLGPCTGVAPLATNERYNIASNTWMAVAPLPTPRSDVGVIAHGGKIYVFGGCTGPGASTATSEVDIYDPTKNSWSSGAPLPTPRSGFYGIGIKGDTIYVMGGLDRTGAASAANEAYNIAHNSWSEATPLPFPRGEMGVVSHGGRIYLVGGGLPAFGTPQSTNDVFKP